MRTALTSHNGRQLSFGLRSPRSAALVIALLTTLVALPATAAATPGPLFQLHRDGSIYGSTGVPCSANGCPGWVQLDNNRNTVAISASGAMVFQLHRDGSIYESTGVPCSANGCPGWVQLDNNPATFAISTGPGIEGPPR